MSKNKYPVKAKKNAVHSKVNGISLRRLSYFYDLMLYRITITDEHDSYRYYYHLAKSQAP